MKHLLAASVLGAWLAAFPAAVAAQEPALSAIRDAAARAVASVQTAQELWYTTNKQVCASCHHQYQPALAFKAARDHGVPVNEAIARADAVKAFTFADLDRAIQYTHVIEPAMDDAYRMVAAHAAGVPPNLGAAVYARLLISRQNAAGDWDGFHQRPPSSHSRVTMAALGLRAVQLYHHSSQKAQADAAVARARAFLESRTPRDTEERVYQLLGLRWAGVAPTALQARARDLKAIQQADGGWASLPGRESDVYSTGQALVALHDAANVAIIDAAYRRGVEYLLRTQAPDGSWRMASRLHPPAPLSPPYFDAGYPGERQQFISMSGAGWAIMALSYALGPARASAPPALADIAPSDVEPWAETMLFGSVDEVRRLLDGGLDPNASTRAGGTTALMMAAPDVAKMRLLLDRGADVNARAKTRFSALMVAAQYQDSEAAINLLLDRGAQVAAPADGAPVFNANPFFLASNAGNARVLKRLLSAGSRLDDAMLVIGTSRATPMLGAFKFGDVEVARTLLELGAPVDFADGNGITMLGRSVLNNEVEMARMLIDRGASVNVVDKMGMTPLLWAANVDFGDSAMVDLLLEAGARADARTKEGLTALELARKYGHANLIPSLERAGGGRAPSTAAAACDRDCLRGILTAYLDALVARDPGRLPAAPSVRFTEDTVPMTLGGGLWQKASKLGSFRQDFLDVREGVAAAHVIVHEESAPVMLALRLKVADRRIAEAETMVVRSQREGMIFQPDALVVSSKAMGIVPPPAARNTRDDLIAIAEKYPAGLRIGSFVSAGTPFSPDAYRVENGRLMAGPGCTFAPGCDDIATQKIPTLAGVTQRVVAVDEDLGIVLLRLDFGPRSVPGPTGAKESLIVWEAFKVYGGQIHAVEAFMEVVPLGTRSGWD